MYACILNVLHHATNHAVHSVAQRVNVCLEGVLEKTIDQYRVIRRRPHCVPEVISERALVIYNFHSPAPEHVRGSHQNRIPHAFGNCSRLR